MKILYILLLSFLLFKEEVHVKAQADETESNNRRGSKDIVDCQKALELLYRNIPTIIKGNLKQQLQVINTTRLTARKGEDGAPLSDATARLGIAIAVKAKNAAKTPQMKFGRRCKRHHACPATNYYAKALKHFTAVWKKEFYCIRKLVQDETKLPITIQINIDTLAKAVDVLTSTLTDFAVSVEKLYSEFWKAYGDAKNNCLTKRSNVHVNKGFDIISKAYKKGSEALDGTCQMTRFRVVRDIMTPGKLEPDESTKQEERNGYKDTDGLEPPEIEHDYHEDQVDVI